MDAVIVLDTRMQEAEDISFALVGTQKVLLSQTAAVPVRNSSSAKQQQQGLVSGSSIARNIKQGKMSSSLTKTSSNGALVGNKVKLSPRSSKGGCSLPPIPPCHPSQQPHITTEFTSEDDLQNNRSSKMAKIRSLRSSFPSCGNELGLGNDAEDNVEDSANTSLISNGKVIVGSMKKGVSKKLRSSLSSSKANNTYRYKVLPGNNSRCILASLKKRPWWHSSFSASSSSSTPISLATPLSDNDAEDFSLPPPNFIWEMYRNSSRYSSKNIDYYRTCLISKIPKNKYLVTKKGLYYTIKTYCDEKQIDTQSIIPLTFYLSPNSGNPANISGTENQSENKKDMDELDDYVAFSQFCENNPKGIAKEEIRFIMKPASKTNRGFGIKVVQGYTNVMNSVKRGYSAGKAEGTTSTKGKGNKKDIGKVDNNTSSSSSAAATAALEENNALSKAAKRICQQDGYIVQLYIEHPLLIQQRKFDIRCFVLVTHSKQNGGLKAYFYPNAYIRTSSKKYNLNNLNDREIHLTNDAVQKFSNAYGKYEDGNKLSLEQWQQLLVEEYGGGSSNPTPGLSSTVKDYIMPEIQRICQFSIEAVSDKFQQSDMLNSFEVFGYDFMICDREKDAVPGTQDMANLPRFYPVLIEVNTNPCLEFVTPLLEEILTDVIESSIRISVDTVFPPPTVKQGRTRATEEAIAELEAHVNKFIPIYPL